MSNALAISICCAAGLVATAAAAQSVKPAPSTTVSPLTVQGASPKTIAAQSRAFVQSTATAPNPEIGQISRWHETVCVQVEGLAEAAQAQAIKDRIESVAQAVGLKAPRKGCKANVEIVFSDDPQGVMDDVAKRNEELLGYYHRSERNRLKTVKYPVQAWYRTMTRGEGHNAGLAFAAFAPPSGRGSPPILGSYVPDMPGRTAGNLRIDDPENGAPTSCGDSPHFTACLTSEFANVFIVVDSKALRARGVGVGVAADYVALLALSQPKSLDGCASLSSVLDLTAKSACPGRDPPDGLTPADGAWLTALYASDGAEKGDGEKSEIALRMTNILVKASLEGRTATNAPAAGGR